MNPMVESVEKSPDKHKQYDKKLDISTSLPGLQAVGVSKNGICHTSADGWKLCFSTMTFCLKDSSPNGNVIIEESIKNELFWTKGQKSKFLHNPLHLQHNDGTT